MVYYNRGFETIKNPRLGQEDEHNRKYGKCPICGAKQWFYMDYREMSCQGNDNMRQTNQQRYKHQKHQKISGAWRGQFPREEIVWRENCEYAKEIA